MIDSTLVLLMSREETLVIDFIVLNQMNLPNWNIKRDGKEQREFLIKAPSSKQLFPKWNLLCRWRKERRNDTEIFMKVLLDQIDNGHVLASWEDPINALCDKFNDKAIQDRVWGILKNREDWWIETTIRWGHSFYGEQAMDILWLCDEIVTTPWTDHTIAESHGQMSLDNIGIDLQLRRWSETIDFEENIPDWKFLKVRVSEQPLEQGSIADPSMSTAEWSKTVWFTGRFISEWETIHWQRGEDEDKRIIPTTADREMNFRVENRPREPEYPSLNRWSQEEEAIRNGVWCDLLFHERVQKRWETKWGHPSSHQFHWDDISEIRNQCHDSSLKINQPEIVW
jgi:hypothetical protein